MRQSWFSASPLAALPQTCSRLCRNRCVSQSCIRWSSCFDFSSSSSFLHLRWSNSPSRAWLILIPDLLSKRNTPPFSFICASVLCLFFLFVCLHTILNTKRKFPQVKAKKRHELEGPWVARRFIFRPQVGPEPGMAANFSSQAYILSISPSLSQDP